MPKLSVCIPAYNNPLSLKKAVESVALQNYEDYEIIITDDSPDNAVEEVLIAGNYTKIKYFKNAKRLGSPENWNEAIRRANGRYIKILHHDDYLSSDESLFTFVKMLDDNPKANIAFSATYAEYPNKEGWMHQLGKIELEQLTKNPLILFENNLIGAPSTTIFRSTTSFKFDTNLKWNVDKEFYIRLLLNNPHFEYCTTQLVTTGIIPGRVTDLCESNKTVQVYEYLYTLEKIKAMCHNTQLKRSYFSCVLHTIKILNQFGITNAKEIIDCGYTSRLDSKISHYLKLKKANGYMAGAYLRWLRQKAKAN
jgi:glycosyltransferase involved in cell wall biosynthesis